MADSSLVSFTLWSPNYSDTRKTVNRVVPHCVVGQCTAQRIGQIFANPARQASSNYGIAFDGSIGQYVREKHRSWCTSSAVCDNQALTYEIASDSYDPYAITDAALQACIDLTVDICKRYGKTKCIWIADKSKNLAYVPKDDEILITAHRFYAAKACPGDYIFQREDYIAEKVNEALAAIPWGVDDYVGGLYKYALNRNPDAKGYENWCRRIMRGEKTAAQVAWGFFGSTEYTKKNTADERYVQQLYEALLRREPDKTGKRNRLKQLANGVSRKDVCAYITNSREFKKFCDRRELICR